MQNLRTLRQGYSNLQETSTLIRLKVVGELYNKEITTSRKTLFEIHANFQEIHFATRKLQVVRGSKKISNLLKGFFALFRSHFHICKNVIATLRSIKRFNMIMCGLEHLPSML